MKKKKTHTLRDDIWDRMAELRMLLLRSGYSPVISAVHYDSFANKRPIEEAAAVMTRCTYTDEFYYIMALTVLDFVENRRKTPEEVLREVALVIQDLKSPKEL